MAQFTIRNLTFTYPERSSPALEDISLTIERGQFITLCGPSGCGKTTLLKHLKPILSPHGSVKGEVLFNNLPIQSLGKREQSEKIGFVTQSPDNQIVTDKVWHELAFGLENLGYPTSDIRLKIAETASFFGIQTWYNKNTSELSGGQKQLISLASVMVMQPEVLILDEPTSRLDPIAASDFLTLIGKINRELGITVIMTEHRLDEVFPMSDRAVCMDKGKLICDAPPSETGLILKEYNHSMFSAMPVPMRIYAAVPNTLQCPVTVREGRKWLDEIVDDTVRFNIFGFCDNSDILTEPAIEFCDIWFKYDKDMPDILKGLSFNVKKGDFFCILGGNGTGKTTALTIASGINKPYRGKVKLFGERLENIGNSRLFGGILGVLPQNPQSLFVKKTVYEDLSEILSKNKTDINENESLIHSISRLCHIEKLLFSHPYDLSGGEQQRAALAKVLLLKPQILLLDEPSKGFDAEFKCEFAAILRALNREGVTIVMVSHDIEFCAEHAKRCAMFFDGNIISEESPREFFSGNSFYTTAANRMSRHIFPKSITTDDVIQVLGGKIQQRKEIDNPYNIDYTNNQPLSLPRSEKAHKSFFRQFKSFSPLKRIVFYITLTLFLITISMIYINRGEFITFLSGGSEVINLSKDSEIIIYAILLLSLCIEAGIISGLFYSKKDKFESLKKPAEKRGLSKRTWTAMGIILAAIPMTIFFGIYFLDDRKYYFISMLIILETILPFMLVFESRKPRARELVIISVLCAIGVAGRAAFFMIPQFKPVAAIVIISGVAFGGETGFLVGAITAFVSNMYFTQGTWTPWQMFAFGIIGFLAGVLFRKGLISRGRIPLCVFGGLATFIVYGIIMDTSTVFTYQENINFPMLLAAYLQGIPFNLIHAASTIIFLWTISQPMLEKLERIKVKYGLAE